MIDYRMIPERCRGGLQRYVEQGVPPGSFLQAVLSNDLVDAFGRADMENQARLRDYTLWLYNCAPSYPVRCWGSREIVEQWIKRGGLKGIQQEAEEANGNHDLVA